MTYAWRGPFENAELNALHAEGFGDYLAPGDWWAQVSQHSLGWVCAREAGTLAGFVNVAWDGATHAFILDTVVAARLQRRGVGSALVALAAEEARAAGCEWLHVDFGDELRPFYFDGCGFAPTTAGLIALGPAQSSRAQGTRLDGPSGASRGRRGDNPPHG
jgi:GNAT superfamily N-acetyltransferase